MNSDDIGRTIYKRSNPPDRDAVHPSLQKSDALPQARSPVDCSAQNSTQTDAASTWVQAGEAVIYRHPRFRLHIQIGSYNKVGGALQPNPYIHCPEFTWEFTGQELLAQSNLRQELGGAELFAAIERVSEKQMPRDVSGEFTLPPQARSHGFVPIYLSGRQVDDSKVWTSPLFIEFG